MTYLASELYGIGVYPVFPCPQTLFQDIVNINQLRKVCAVGSPSIDGPTLPTADQLISHIITFSPEQWAESFESSFDIWCLIARIFQSAVASYGISSLLSAAALRPTLKLTALAQHHRHCLVSLIREARTIPLVKNSIVWPVIVAGVAATHLTINEQSFIGKTLTDMSEEIGFSTTLVAKAALEKYWASGRTKWDECFDRPYALLM